MASCPDVVVDCPFPGCSVRVARRELAQHLVAASDAHVKLAQATHSRLMKAESTLGSLSCTVQLSLHLARDVEEGNWEGRAYVTDMIELKIMEPIVSQEEFRDFFSEHDLSLTTCTATVDITKSPFDLGIDNVSSICISTEVLPAHLVPRPAAHHSAPVSGVPGMSEALNIKVITEDGHELFFKCKTDTRLERLMTAFCTRQGLDMALVRAGLVRFLFDGEVLRPEQTPEDVEMEDGDIIDVIYGIAPGNAR